MKSLRQKKDMITLMTQAVTTFIFQMILCLFILTTTVKEDLAALKYEPPTMDLAFTRFMTCMIMSVALMSEITMGMEKMKYALNH